MTAAQDSNIADLPAAVSRLPESEKAVFQRIFRVDAADEDIVDRIERAARARRHRPGQ